MIEELMDLRESLAIWEELGWGEEGVEMMKINTGMSVSKNKNQYS